MSHFWEMMLTVLTASAVVAIVALIVSRQSNTSGVVQSLASGWGNILSVAISPVTGKAATPNLSYPGDGVMNQYSMAGGSPVY